MWKLKFNAPIHTRAMKDVFLWVVVWDKNPNTHWWVYDDNKVFSSTRPEFYKSGSNCMSKGCNSIKAFKKYLQKYCNHLKDCEVVLVSRYYFTDIQGNQYDYSVTATWED